MIDKALVRKHFDRHAFEYDQFARVQQRMATDLYELTATHAPADVQDILEIGCGTGLLTVKLVQQFPHSRFTLLDISGEMLKQTEQKLDFLRVNDSYELIEADAEEWAKEQARANKYDMIISSATFQWFNRPEETIARYWRKLKPGGLFAFSTFCSRTFEELHKAFHEAETKLNYPPQRRGQSFLTMDDWDRLFARVKPEPARLQANDLIHQEAYDSVRQFLAHVKRVGAGNAMRTPTKRNNQGGIVSRQLFKQMESMYHHLYGRDGIIPATYHIGYAIYQKEGDERS